MKKKFGRIHVVLALAAFSLIAILAIRPCYLCSDERVSPPTVFSFENLDREDSVSQQSESKVFGPGSLSVEFSSTAGLTEHLPHPIISSSVFVQKTPVLRC